MHRGQCTADSSWCTCSVLSRHVCTHIESTYSTSAVLAEVLSTQSSMSSRHVSNPRKQEMEALVDADETMNRWHMSIRQQGLHFARHQWTPTRRVDAPRPSRSQRESHGDQTTVCLKEASQKHCQAMSLKQLQSRNHQSRKKRARGSHEKAYSKL